MDAPIDSLTDRWRLLPAYLKVRGIVKQHIDSYNYFVDVELKKLLLANQYIRCDEDPNFYVRFIDIRVGKPSIQDQMNSAARVNPMECRLRDITYSGPILVDIEYTRGNTLVQRSNVPIGRIPIMLKSNKCILADAVSDEDFAKYTECPHDPGGYFICNGVEKVIMAQEQMSNNRVLMDLDKYGYVRASCNSSTHMTKSKTIMFIKKNVIYVQHNSFTSDIPVVIVLKAFGLQSDQEAIQLVGLEYLDIFAASVEHCKSLKICTQIQALSYIGNRVRVSPALAKRKLSKPNIALEVLSTVVLAHIPAFEFDFHGKSIFASIMIRRILEAVHDPSKLDDKDYYGNKRLQLAGDLIAILMEDLFKTFCSQIRREASSSLSKKSRASQFDVIRYIKADYISRGLETAISSGNWRIRRFRMDRAGITQTVTRLSYLSSLGTMTKVNSQFEKSRKVSGPRSLQPSQFGMMCPSDTPEGENCGLLKNLALVTHVTTDSDEKPISRTAYALGVERMELLSTSEIFSDGSYIVILNGTVLGLVLDPMLFVQRFRALRRSGKIDAFVSVYYNVEQKAIFLSSDAGRVCRPLIIVKSGKCRLTSTHLTNLDSKSIDFNDLLEEGVVEYLDVNEENDSLIATAVSEITCDSTHLEIDPLTLLGICAGLIPYPHHNQSPRNTYQSVMGKQAMGAIGYNQFRRIDTVLYLLCYPQKPLVKTKTIEFIGFEHLPAGHNATVAVMSYSGYDIEDAIILNRSSLDRGFGRCLVTKKHKSVLLKYPNGESDRVVIPETFSRGTHALDHDGIVNVGAQVRNGDVLVNREVPRDTKTLHVDPALAEYIPSTLKFKGPCLSAIDDVMISSNSRESLLLKINVRSTRRPERGDKFSSRHGQKGVCGLIVNQEDMPFTDQGICPDLIMNPHGFPSRMTVGKMMELISGKAGVLDGDFKYGTAFAGDSVKDMGEILTSHGFSFTGKDTLTSGISGEQLEAYIFMGPVYYQKLKHMVMDKIHARSTGPRSNLTRQPTEGRSNEGGLRLGEMERDCLIGYGASLLLQERLMISSDCLEVNVCETCGLIGYEKENGDLWCTYCQVGSSLVKMEIPYATKLLFQEMLSMGILPRLKLKPM